MTIETLLAMTGVVLVAAITPGPNNVAVMRAASGAGPRGAASAIVAILLGTLALFATAWLGGALALDRWPRLRGVMAIAGALYLAWLGVSLVVRAAHARAEDREPDRASRFIGLFAFQLVNPKAWAMMVAVVSSVPVRSVEAFVELAALFVVVPAGCLTTWAILGTLLARAFRDRRARARLDGALGGLLVMSAVALVLEVR
jgi:threonine/homoserine/homoserine lactone efflux protein